MSDKSYVPKVDEQLIIDKVVEILAKKILNQGKGKTSTKKRKPAPAAREQKVEDASLQTEQFIQEARKREREKIKQRIKKAADERHFKTSVDYGGFIDILIERNNVTIACEIFDSENTESRIGDVLECLAGGYNKLIICVTEKKGIDVIRSVLTGRLSVLDMQKVLVVGFDGFIEYLNGISDEEISVEDCIKGRRIKVVFKPLSIEQAQQKSDSIKRVLARHLSGQ